MIPWLKALLFDETVFQRWGRATIFGLGTAMHMGIIPGLDGTKSWWIGPALATLALVIGAGEKNQPPNGKLILPDK